MKRDLEYILGVNAYHGDASAALIVDGELVAAVEEERFNRIKHWAGFPSESIRYCLEVGGICPSELDHVAISFDPRANLRQRMLFVAKKRRRRSRERSDPARYARLPPSTRVVNDLATRH